MQVKIEFIGAGNNLPDQEKRSIVVEQHVKRGETWNVERSTPVLQSAAAQVYDVPPGGRLLLQMPEEKPEVVFDPAQGAAIRTANQANAEGRADKPTEHVQQAAPPPPPQPTPPPRPQPSVQTRQQPQPTIPTRQPPHTPTQTPIENKPDSRVVPPVDSKDVKNQ